MTHHITVPTHGWARRHLGGRGLPTDPERPGTARRLTCGSPVSQPEGRCGHSGSRVASSPRGRMRTRMPRETVYSYGSNLVVSCVGGLDRDAHD